MQRVCILKYEIELELIIKENVSVSSVSKDLYYIEDLCRISEKYI